MPSLNEAETLEVCIKKAIGFMEREGIVGEVVVADNGSTDGSQEIAKRAGARVVHVERKGYGAALLGGIRAARGTYVIMGDSDDSYDFSELGLYVERLRAGDELVMGDRFRGGIAPGAMPNLHRYLGNPVLSFAGRTLFGSRVRDFQCGLRGFDRRAMLSLGLQSEGMEFASEMVLKATRHALKISEVPTTLSRDGRSRAPHLRSWRDGWRTLRFQLIHSPRSLFLLPGITLVVTGLALFALILPGPLRVFGITLDVHTLAVAGGMIVLGTQMLTFGVLAKQYCASAGILPPTPRLEKVLRFWRLERALGFGLVALTAGLGAMLYAIGTWGAVGLGDLEYGRTMRFVLPGVTGMVVGVQILLSGFMSSILELKPSRD